MNPADMLVGFGGRLINPGDDAYELDWANARINAILREQDAEVSS